MNPTGCTLIVRLSSDAKSDRDWRDFYELYHTPLLAAAKAAGFTPAECTDIFQETLACLVTKGFQSFLANGNTLFCNHLSREAYRYFQKAYARKTLVSSEAPTDAPFGSSQSAGPESVQGFLYQHLTTRILEAFIESDIFSHGAIRSVYALLTPQIGGQQGEPQVVQAKEKVSAEVYDAIIRALMIVQQSVDQGANLDEAMDQLENYFD